MSKNPKIYSMNLGSRIPTTQKQFKKCKHFHNYYDAELINKPSASENLYKQLAYFVLVVLLLSYIMSTGAEPALVSEELTPFILNSATLGNKGSSPETLLLMNQLLNG